MARLLTSVLVSIGLCFGVSAQEVWDDAKQEAFLENAEIGEIKKVGIGTTGSSVATLTMDGVTKKAGVQSVDIYMERFIAEGAVEFNFKDSYKFNIAGYQVDRFIGLNMVPVTVERKIKGKPASVSMWVDNVKMDGTEFIDGGHAANQSSLIKDQRDQAEVFQQLIENTDPNLGNWVVDDKDKIWLIDFSRAFRTGKKLQRPEQLKRIGENLLETLRTMDATAAKKDLKGYLEGSEIKALTKRAEVIVAHFDELIASQGADAVLIRRDGF